MGFRSTMITGDWDLKIPKEFAEKYPYLNFHAVKNEKGETEKLNLPISTQHEIKFYSDFEETELFKDIQKLMIEQDFGDINIELVLLHECGGISKVHINKDKIIGMEPTDWKIVKGVEHNYCYGCSDPNLLSN